MPPAELLPAVTFPAASTTSSIPQPDGLGMSVLLVEFGPQSRSETPSTIKSPSQNLDQGSWTQRCLRSGRLAASLNVHGWRESHVTPVTSARHQPTIQCSGDAVEQFSHREMFVQNLDGAAFSGNYKMMRPVQVTTARDCNNSCILGCLTDLGNRLGSSLLGHDHIGDDKIRQRPRRTGWLRRHSQPRNGSSRQGCLSGCTPPHSRRHCSGPQREPP